MCKYFYSQIIERVRFVHSITKPSKNVHNSLYSMHTFVKEYQQLFIFNVHKYFKKIYIHNYVYSMYTIFFFLCLDVFFKNYWECKLCIFNTNTSKNVHILYIQSIKIMYTILYIQRKQFIQECTLCFILKLHNFLNNIHNYIYSMYAIFNVWTLIVKTRIIS